MEKKKTIIVGGVAGGASCAARLRRLDEEREIIILEKGDYISFANCGLPYHISDVIEDREDLLLMTPELMHDRFRIDVRVKNEVVAIDKEKKTITVLDHNTKATYEENYDELVLATGSSPLRPHIPGIDSKRIHTLWNINDTDEIKSLLKDVHTVAVIGGGFIGLEMADNLHHAGKEVSIIEASNQVMAPLDYEMAQLLHQNIGENGVALYLNDGVERFEEKGNTVSVFLQSGKEIVVDLVILSIGVRPNSTLAKDAGLTLNERGGIVVDAYLKTSDPNIYAVGDVIEVEDYIFHDRTMIPLAGPANKQGRMVADNIAGAKKTYNGTQGSSVAKVFDLTAASTGANEKALARHNLVKGKDYETITIKQNSHAGYYPGAKPLVLKLIFSKDGKKIYGAQIVGEEGVDKRIDTIGTAIHFGASVLDLKDMELAYAPPYSSAKDPVNMAGFVAENVLHGFVQFASYDEPDTNKEAILLDVREAEELEVYAIPGAKHIPLGQLREALPTLNKEKDYIIFCAVGVRAYNAARLMQQNGFAHVKIYPGGVRFFEATHYRNN